MSPILDEVTSSNLVANEPKPIASKVFPTDEVPSNEAIRYNHVALETEIPEVPSNEGYYYDEFQ